MRRAALIDDELILACKFWKVPMDFAPPKEKADAAAIRQALVREKLKEAETKYAAELKANTEVMTDWFFHGAERKAGL